MFLYGLEEDDCSVVLTKMKRLCEFTKDVESLETEYLTLGLHNKCTN
jgi:hypothetical protein